MEKIITLLSGLLLLILLIFLIKQWITSKIKYVNDKNLKDNIFGIEEAYYRTGKNYYHGINNMKKDKGMAFYFWEKAAEGGHKYSKYLIIKERVINYTIVPMGIILLGLLIFGFAALTGFLVLITKWIMN